MKSKLGQGITVLGVVAVLFVFARTSQGQLTGVLNSNVEGFFSADSDVHQQSEGPPAGQSWLPVGFTPRPRGMARRACPFRICRDCTPVFQTRARRLLKTSPSRR